METKKAVTMIRARVTEIPPPAMSAYKRRQGLVMLAANFLTDRVRRSSSERFRIQVRRENERKATIPNWSPEMARRWAMPVTMKRSLISSGIPSCSPKTRASKMPAHRGSAFVFRKSRM